MKTKGCRIFAGLFCSFLVFSTVISSWTEVHAEISEYPNRPITLVVATGAGGATDLTARAVAEAMEKHLKQPMVVVNKPGGAGTIGGNVVVTAKPDGYTLGFFSFISSLPEAFRYFYEAPYTSKDLRPISRIVYAVTGVTVRGDAPWNSIKDLVEFAKKQGGFKILTAGKNSQSYMFVRILEKREKAGITAVPMNSDAEVLTALLGGHAPGGMLYNSMAIKGLVDAKKLKILAFCLKDRTDFAPDIPTVVELGYKLPPVGALGVYGPQKVQDEVVEKIDGVARKIVEEPDFKAKIKSMGLPRAYEGPSGFEKFNAQSKEQLEDFFKEEGLVKK